MIRWLEREEMQFDEYGDACGYATVKVLQWSAGNVVGLDGEPITVWADVPTVRE